MEEAVDTADVVMIAHGALLDDIIVLTVMDRPIIAASEKLLPF